MARRKITPKNSVGRKRLVALADYFDKNLSRPKWAEFFKMDTWALDMFTEEAGGYDPKALKAYEREYGTPKPGKPVVVNKKCGTSGCLLGHAVNVPVIAREGLNVVFNDDLSPSLRLNKRQIVMNDLAIGPNQITESDLARKLFGISGDRFEQIFRYEGENGEMAEVTAEEAVANLRLVIARIDANEGWLI